MPELLSTLGPIATDECGTPTLPYWRLFTGDDGLSSVAASLLDGFAEQSVGGKAAAMWMLAAPGTVEAVRFAILPVGWVGEWHESPMRQWVVTLSGRWFIETQDGLRIEMGPGDIHWGEDLGTRQLDGDHGHRSGQLGDGPCAHLLVQFRAPSEGAQPLRLSEPSDVTARDRYRSVRVEFKLCAGSFATHLEYLGSIARLRHYPVSAEKR